MVSSISYSDVSWGTTGDTKVSTDLGVAKANKGENAVEVAVPTAEKDINAAYEDAIHVLSTKPPKEEKKVDAATAQENYYRTFRTKCVASPPILAVVDDPFLLCSVLLAWVLSNVSC
jgi:chitin synthase